MRIVHLTSAALSFQRDDVSVPASAQRHRDGESDLLHAGLYPQPFGELTIEYGGALVIVSLALQIETGDRDVLHLKTGIYGLGGMQSARQQPSRDEQHQAHRNLDGQQDAAQPSARPSAAGSFLECRAQIDL